jgi:hypothetical protein
MSDKEIALKSSSFEMILRSAIGLPGVRINREGFLRKELSKHHDDDVVNKAIATNPAQAGLSVKNLDHIAKACITFETRKVSAISAAAGLPGGFAMAATIPADVAQFFGHVIRVLQKLAYLYGWQDMFKGDTVEIDDETANELTLFIGVMFGVSAANAALSKVAALAALNVPKKLMQQALTKGTIYPIVKKIASAVGIKMTKAVFTKGVGKIIPVVGAVASGGITYALFKPMSLRLKKYLATLPTASVDFYKKPHSDDEIIDVDFSDISFDDEEIDDTSENAVDVNKYWVGDCPIGGPFDLWRKNYFIANGSPPDDTGKMYPALSTKSITTIAIATVLENATFDDVINKNVDIESEEQAKKAYAYFSEWRKHAPFLPDSMQDLPLRPARTSPEPIEEFLDDWNKLMHDENNDK